MAWYGSYKYYARNFKAQIKLVPNTGRMRLCPRQQFPWYGMVWYGMVWYGMVWYGMVWYGMVWYGMVWYGMVWYGMVWYGMVWYGMVWYGMSIAGGAIPEALGKRVCFRRCTTPPLDMF